MADPVRKLKDEAVNAVAKGQWKKALECYLGVERAEPHDGIWPQKAGEALRRLGRAAEAVEAYGRAANAYSRGGFLLRAIAVCKLILELDPRHTATQERLAALHSARAADSPTRGATPGVAAASAPPLRPPTPGSSAAAAAPVSPAAAPAPAPAATSAPRPAPAALLSEPSVHEILIEIDDEGLEPLVAQEAPGAPGAPGAPAPSPEACRDEAIRRALPRTPLFSALEERHLRMLIDRVLLVRLEPGEVLFRQGDPGNALFVVTSGQLTVRVRAEGGAEADADGMVEVAHLGEGAFLGEIALLAEQPRSATVAAAEATELLAIHRDTIDALVADSEQVRQVLLRFLRDRLLNSMVETNRLFAPLTPRERMGVAARLRFLQADPESTLIAEGGRAPGLFVVLAGNVVAWRGEVRVGPLRPGDLFGEGPLLDDRPATFAVRTASRSFLLGLSAGDLRDLTSTQPRVLAAIRALAAERDRRLGG